MQGTLKAPGGSEMILNRFWNRYFSETPTCTTQSCGEVAVEVDPFFPYLDDFNRCAFHREEEAGNSVS